MVSTQRVRILTTRGRAAAIPRIALEIAMRVALIGTVVALHSHLASAQSARDIKGPTELVAIPDEAPAKLIVDPPIPEQLALGRVMIQYRAENLRIVPVYGKGALSVSPRVGHLHYAVDDQTWPTVDTSDGTLVLVGLKSGPHKVTLELADPTHQAIPATRQTLTFTVPDAAAHPH